MTTTTETPLRFHSEDSRRFPVAAYKGNLRAHDLMKHPELQDLITQGKSFSVSIVNGKGEVWMKKINGEWHSKVDHCDQVFGFIRAKYRKV